ncbi:basic leucine zipper transcriptional factor ATF-like 2 [Pontoporia blainvillei]|uniref:Basic leucine zipper transcriptional factor ATF-like 2 n=1 Tax=Pontoporia blainvillei TaxID=48723 RepID=A0ABX0S6B0_PONBL|nr:basic leucine zipper transcriptional factor ATF-like 2 [Pontoporia blainvillei]
MLPGLLRVPCVPVISTPELGDVSWIGKDVQDLSRVSSVDFSTIQNGQWECDITREDPEEHQRQLKKKQNNRAAAQRSRQKHRNKADALHQQHESLEKHNHTLRKEIQALQAELAWWSRTLHMHERLCPMDCASCLTPVPPGCWGQAEWPPGPVCPGQHGCQERPGPFRTPVSSPVALQLSPDPQPHGSLGLLLSPLPSLSLGPAPVTASSA